jgi:hypothetical protein
MERESVRWWCLLVGICGIGSVWLRPLRAIRGVRRMMEKGEDMVDVVIETGEGLHVRFV